MGDGSVVARFSGKFERGTRRVPAAVPVLLAVFAGCGGSAVSEPVAAQSAASPNEVASCGEAGLGAPPKSWKDDASVAGPFGLFGPARDFHDHRTVIKHRNGQFGAKLPAIIEGSSEVTLTVPAPFSRRVGLDFGDLRTASRVKDANSEVTFKPCKDQSRTGWPGGLVLKDRRPIELTVHIEGEDQVRTLAVG